MKLFSVGLAIASAFSLAACGGAAHDPATQQILDSQGSCDNPVRLERPETRESSADALVDGQPGRYRATEVTYFFDLSSLISDHATQTYHSAVSRGTVGADPKYSLDITCNRGYTQARVNASFDFPDTIDRKDGSIVLQTEKFRLNDMAVSSHTSQASPGHKLDEFLSGLRSVGGALTVPDVRIFRSSERAFELVIKISDFDFNESNAFVQIHYELN